MGLLERILHWAEPVQRQDDSADWTDSYETQIGNFWANLASSAGATNPTLIDRVWVANRCLQMNSNAVSTMPLRFYGNREPAWVANPDPNWFPAGIGDAVFAITWSLYAYGDAFLLVTSRYADGFPSAWTVLSAANITVEESRGHRIYRSGEHPLNERDVVQITRDPRGGLRGTSAIAAYSAYTNGLLAAADLGRVMMGSGGIPSAVLKSQRKLTAEQASALQEQWMGATALRRGAPAVLPPEIDFEQLAFSPADLMLLDVQKFDATVIATAFGVPANFINMPLEGLAYSTPILSLEQWWRTELRPTATRVARALSNMMLPAGAYVEFDSRDFLAPSFKDLVDSYAALIKDGVVTIEEARAVVLGLPPGHSEEEALAALSEPPSAGASPAQQPAEVVALRPTQVGTQ